MRLLTALRATVGLAATFLFAVPVAAQAVPLTDAPIPGDTTIASFAGIDQRTILVASVPAAVTAFINAKGGHAGIAVRDQITGATVEINENRVFQTASIVKFDILATRLYQTQTTGSTLSAGQRGLAYAMITRSDNNAASALYALDHGAAGVSSANRVFGLRNTTPRSSWGRTHTTPADQLRLLSTVLSTSGPLNATNRAYILSLMSRVEPDQRWGITAAATPAATHVYVKNGWVEMDDFGHMQGDNSIGRIVEPGHDWLVAVMSNYNRSDAAGEALLGQLANLAVSGLRAEAAAPVSS